MSASGPTLLGLSAVVTLLVAVLAFALLRFSLAAREARGHVRRRKGADSPALEMALQEAVTRIKAQERAMSARAEASEHLNSQIVASLTAGLLLVDRTGRVDMLNPAGRRLLDVTREPAGTDYRELLAAVPPLVDAIAECLASGQPIVRRALRMPDAARATHLGVTVSPLAREGAGAPAGAICLFSDLSAIVELEEQLRLKETLARLGELTAGIAHEFRNGLATIHGYSRLIDPGALPERFRPYVDGIRQETDSLGKVVTNFLRFARPERMTFAPVPLDDVVRRAVDDLRLEGPSGTAIEVSGAFGEIEGDEVLLRQVFDNLLRNAVEACQEAGCVPAVSIQGGAGPEQGVCRISVDDNGPGIPEAARGRVFEPFFTTRARGTGLGLAIVQKIVVMHNGRVAVRASAGGGASVQLTFPLRN